MSDEEKLEEVSTPSPAAEDTAAPSEAQQPDIVQKDQENNRKSIGDTVRDAVEFHKREPSPARQAVAKARPRTEDGKFVPRDEKSDSPADAAPSKEAKAETQSPTEKPVETTPASKPAVEAPTSWSPEAKATWASIPPAVQQAVAKREKEVADGFSQYQTRYQDIDRAFGPDRDRQLQQLGKSRGEAVNQLFHWHDALANPQTKLQAFSALARAHGIDPSTLVPQIGQSQQQDPNAAYVDQLVQQRLQQLVSPVLSQVDQRIGSYEQQIHLDAANRQLAEFSKDKPHFERVRQAMSQMMMGGYAQGLDDAYQKATWADSEIRGEILAQEQAKREADAKAAQEAAQAKAATAEDERKRKEREAADKARRANIGVRHSTSAGMPSPSSKSNKSVGESIRETVRDLRA